MSKKGSAPMNSGTIPLDKLIQVAFFSALTAVGAWIAFPMPFSPVPVVLANLFVLLSGVVLGKWLGALSQIVYILMGVIGIPVFAKFTAGPEVLVGPTGGYLIGYVIAAFTVGLLMELLAGKVPEVAQIAVSLTVGALLIYVPGVLWLAENLEISLHAALVAGFYPFLPGDALKVVAATVLSVSLMVQLPHMRRWAAREELAKGDELG
jgi:biotin transport system substrate-specific component